MERDTPVVGNAPTEGPSNLQGTQHPLAEVNISSSSHLEDDRLITRARAVGVDYQSAKPGKVETEDDRRKRQRRNRRQISEQDKRLHEVVGDLPLPPPAGSSQQEDNAYSAMRSFEVEQMTYTLTFCEVCKERRLECKGRRTTVNLQINIHQQFTESKIQVVMAECSHLRATRQTQHRYFKLLCNRT